MCCVSGKSCSHQFGSGTTYCTNSLPFTESRKLVGGKLHVYTYMAKDCAATMRARLFVQLEVTKECVKNQPNRVTN